MRRTDFVRKVCPALTLAILNAAAFVSCSAEDSDEEELIVEDPVSEEEEVPSYNPILDDIDSSGYLYQDEKLYIDLANTNFESLQTVGEFINHMPQGVLLLRRNEDTILAFDHCCPHQGATDLWSFDGNYFTCANHGNSFGVGEGNTAYCNSNTIFGNLKRFTVEIDGELLIVTF
ncbi:Rieske (2Fe-2S) protein [Robertkochia marina]|uniref:Rieske (2Fe-2S) protein n=1 Tax=Robertkochia marina TaxID=1227945 RepID=A0A4V3UY57_9FLAO|nr:Rieske (2Fe-2S) protein [Robertkochia marina]THD67736.1 Rieske (2Fe-2S) protein [Robertkochia marina]TRZ40951.1 Rieske (2Fe-2S) protein [Robertkochia marina]